MHPDTITAGKAQISGPSGTLLNGLINYWNLENGNDLVGSNNLNLNTGYIVPAKIGNGLNSSSSPAVAGYNGSFDASSLSAFSVSFWLKDISSSNIRGFFSLSTAIYSDNFCLFQRGFGVYRWRVGSSYIYNMPAMNQGTWYHIVATWDGSNWFFYLDTSKSAAQSGTPTQSAGMTLWIGYGYNGFSDALIDEVGIWDRVLTDAEVTELYNAGSGITYPF